MFWQKKKEITLEDLGDDLYRKIVDEARRKALEEVYGNLNIAKLFEEEPMEGDLMKLVGPIASALSVILCIFILVKIW